jgi:hypothetical protein
MRLLRLVLLTSQPVGGACAVVRNTIFPKQLSSRSGRALRFEPLEDRRVLTTFTVTNLNDATVTGPGNAPGTLRQAIYDANVSSDADIINFAPGLSGDLRLSIAADSATNLSALLVTSPITIQGNAAGITIKRDVTAPEMRFFRITLGGDLTLNSINLTGGITRGTNGASGQDGGSAFAGAIYNQGNLQIISSTLYNNTAIGGSAGSGGNSGAGQGGAIFNDGGNTTIRNSTLSGNSVSNGFGPLVARSFGGGIYSKNGLLKIDNSTITNGSAASGRELYAIGIGTGQTATLQIRSSIIAQSDVTPQAYDFNATDDLGGQILVTGSNNIIRSQNRFPSIRISSDDPLLVPLANNGGATLTHALLADSPAIGHGSNPMSLANDQRSDTFIRVVGGATDIGAYEVQAVATPSLPGDYNTSQTVDAADYILWRKTKNASVTQYSGADGNGSGTIDDADYGVWRGNFGASSPGSGTEVGLQRAVVTIEAPPAASSAQRNDIARVVALSSYRGLSSDLSIAHGHNWLNEEALSSVSQHARDEALLMITTQTCVDQIFHEPQSLKGPVADRDGAAPSKVSELTSHCEASVLPRIA